VQNREFDFDHIDRSAEYVESALLEKAVPDIQRALFQMFLKHSKSQTPAENKQLRGVLISLRAAAAWIKANVDYVADLKCDHTAVRCALQVWVTRGVMQTVQASSTSRVLWVDFNALQDWYDEQPDAFELPVFQSAATQVLSAVESRRVQLSAVESRRVLLSAVESRRDVLTLEEQTQEQEQNLSSSFSCSDSDSDDWLNQYQPPVDVWDARTDRQLCTAIVSWLKQDDIRTQADRLHKLCGLIVLSRQRDVPEMYFETCVRRGLQPQVARTGRAWWTRMKQQDRAADYSRSMPCQT